jgi:cytochrome o ubiquinol oxidase subunit 3
MTAKLHPGLNLGPAHGEHHAQAEITVFGFWVFLMSDLIIFGILFATYAASTGPVARAGGPGPADLFNLASVGGQTALLLASSFTCGMMSLALKYEEGRGRIAFWLGVTALLGAGFLGLELRDFANMASAGATPMRSAWLSAYFSLVGLHGLHITIGLFSILILVTLIAVRGLDGIVKTRLLVFALYWHFLDLVWIGIFSVVFLGGVA